MRHTDLATELLKTARTAGADAADLLVAEGTEFSVTVRRGEVETLKEAGSKGLGIRLAAGEEIGDDASEAIHLHPKDLPGTIAEFRWCENDERPDGAWMGESSHGLRRVWYG